jgi:hypothetical protein
MQGGIHIARPAWSGSSPSQGGALLYVRLRYFDPERRRAGVPPDVAALVEKLGDDETGGDPGQHQPGERRGP